jgi:hypothetical protein
MAEESFENWLLENSRCGSVYTKTGRWIALNKTIHMRIMAQTRGDWPTRSPFYYQQFSLERVSKTLVQNIPDPKIYRLGCLKNFNYDAYRWKPWLPEHITRIQPKKDMGMVPPSKAQPVGSIYFAQRCCFQSIFSSWVLMLHNFCVGVWIGDMGSASKSSSLIGILTVALGSRMSSSKPSEIGICTLAWDPCGSPSTVGSMGSTPQRFPLW